MNVNTEKLCNEVSCTLELLVLGYKRHWIVRVSRGFNSSRSTMVQLRATVILCLVTSAVLTQSRALTNTTQGTDPIDVSTILSDDQLHDGSINDTLSKISGIPTCTSNYIGMNIINRLLRQDISPMPFAICVRNDGYFVATNTRLHSTYMYLFDQCGWMKIRIGLPNVINSVGCAFTSNKLFVSVTSANLILQFTSGGIYRGIFQFNVPALRLATHGSILYTSVAGSRNVYVYNTLNGNRENIMTSAHGNPRGLAVDRNGNLHVAIWGNIVEIFSPQGRLLNAHQVQEVVTADGIAMDSNFNTIIADRGNHQVLVYNKFYTLIKRIAGFNMPVDVAQGNNCIYLIVADKGGNYIYLL